MTNSQELHRRMTFWEVVSAFRDFSAQVRLVFKQAKVHHPYFEWLQHLDEHVTLQNREVLDSPVPLQLTREIAARIPQLYELDETTGILRRSTKEGENNSKKRTMSTIEVHDSFGGNTIEEINEYGSSKVLPLLD